MSIRKIFRIFRRSDNVQEEAKPEDSTANKSNINIRDYINKFVKQHEKDMGESVAVHDGRLIIKYRGGFMAVPIDAVENNSEIIHIRDFDMDEALMLGKEWFERKDILKFDESGKMVK